MKSTDRFLVGIVVGIVALVIVAFVVTLVRPEPTYQAEDSPEGVAHNYLLALQQGEYERAYGYLSPTLTGYPASVDEFVDVVTDYSWQFRLDADTTLAIELARVVGSRTVVQVRESRFNGGSLFGDSQSITTFDIKLESEQGAWRIVDADHYFARCWRNDKGCQ
ncbi:MAG: hypothetical protein GY832_22580 [Chloroflexi bacterium]|nr:hypothetical protein [Chloroflexota bacterium]